MCHDEIRRAAAYVAQVLAEAGATYEDVDYIFAYAKRQLKVTASLDQTEPCSEQPDC